LLPEKEKKSFSSGIGRGEKKENRSNFAQEKKKRSFSNRFVPEK